MSKHKAILASMRYAAYLGHDPYNSYHAQGKAGAMLAGLVDDVPELELAERIRASIQHNKLMSMMFKRHVT